MKLIINIIYFNNLKLPSGHNTRWRIIIENTERDEHVNFLTYYEEARSTKEKFKELWKDCNINWSFHNYVALEWKHHIPWHKSFNAEMESSMMEDKIKV